MTELLKWLQCSKPSVRRTRIWNNHHGQDLIEYALLAGLMAVAAGAVMPATAKNLNKVVNKVKSALKLAKANG